MNELPSKAISISLTSQARQVIEGLRADTGVPNTEAMARLLEWFAGLDRRLRIAILTRDQETIDRLLPAVVGRMMSVETGGNLKPLVEMDYDELAQVIQGATELLVQRGKAYRTAVAGKLKAKK